ncbi:hypothetical protein GQ44DRAFT_619835 [Phaeosphaeriaceae sp. PMI808]|nr:hypothetical protein GQ44DRAFT_619835 [Phaeosphaeriaceae sp. PMI808]
MFRAAPRLIVRSALPRTIAPARRYISTAPPTQKSRSWKSLAARLGIAGTIIYYYVTTDVFAEEPRQLVQALPETETETEQLPTIEAIAAERQKRKAIQAQLELQAQKEAESAQQNAAPINGGQGGMEDIEEEAGQQGAFNPETGEINWDCPCLGGMADGPCGEEFKAAFSCFVHSTEEPKGMDCIDNFKIMQNCFRKYPEVYGSELDSDADDDEDDLTADAATSTPALADSESRTPSGSTVSPPSKLADSETGAPTEKTASLSPKAQPKTDIPEKAKLSGELSLETHSGKGRGVQGLVPANYKPDGKSDD